MNQYDYFGHEMPKFNYKGQSKLGTPFGLISTVIFATMLALYTISKFVHLVTFKNPLITKASASEQHMTEDESLDLDATKF